MAAIQCPAQRMQLPLLALVRGQVQRLLEVVFIVLDAVPRPLEAAGDDGDGGR